MARDRMTAARAEHGSINGPLALSAVVLLGGLMACSAGNFDKQPCKKDGSCAAALGAGFYCADDGFCRKPAANEPGKCEGTIPFKILHDNSGPLKEVGRSYWKGQIDFLREVNEKGGVRGCQFDIDSFDYAYDPAKATAQYEVWKGGGGDKPVAFDKVVAVLAFGTGDTLALAPQVAVDKKVMTSGSWAGALAAPKATSYVVPVPTVNASFNVVTKDETLASPGYPYNFFVGTDYSNSIRAAVDYIQREAPPDANDRLGFAFCSAAYCTAPLPAGRIYARAAGVALGRDLPIELSPAVQPGLSPEATEAARQDIVDKLVRDYFVQEANQVKATGGAYRPVTWLWIANTNPSAFRIGKALQKVREDTQVARGSAVTPAETFDNTLSFYFKNLKSISNPWGFDEFTIADCKGNKDTAAPAKWCVDNFLGVLPLAVYGATAAGMPELQRVHNKWRQADAALPATDPISDTTTTATAKTYQDVQYVKGYVSMMLLTRGLERVVDAKRKTISGESLKEMLEESGAPGGTTISTDGLTPPLKFSPDDHRPQASVKVYKINAAGSFEQIGQERTIVFPKDSLGW